MRINHRDKPIPKPQIPPEIQIPLELPLPPPGWRPDKEKEDREEPGVVIIEL